jgi:Zn-dependent peptidase ImmA (M78 family)/transcriptional regulator with XRE-family HTH domain
MPFVGERLAIARTFRGLNQTELGKAVSASAALVSMVENGKRTPSPDLVDAFGEVLGFTHEFFTRPVTDAFTENEASFRRRASTSRRLRARVLAHGTLVGEVVRHLHRELSLPVFDVPNLPGESLEHAEAAAEQCRRYWGLGLEAPILTLGRVVERAGVILTELDAGTQKVDAFARWGEVSVIVLNTTVGSPSRTLFDIAHETGHLVMHRGLQPGVGEMEDQANRFAAAFLLPRDGFSRDFLALRRLDWPQLLELKRHWRASLGAMLHRAYELGILDAVRYRRMVQQMYSRGWHRGEPAEPSAERPELLALAFDTLARESGVTPVGVARSLGWNFDTLAEVTGLPLIRPQIDDPHIVSLCEYRGQRGVLKSG